jgi:hypothetical protein
MKNSFPLRNQINNKCFPRYQITPPLSASQSTFSYFTRNNSNFNSTNNCLNSKYNSSRESMQFQPNKSYISTTSSLCRNKSALSKSQNSLKSNVNNKVEMINMRLRCDILLAKIENLKVRIPKHNKVLKNKIIKIKEKNNNEEDVNLSNLADKLVDVFGLENNSNDKLIENIETNEELKIGELITEIITDSGDVNSRNKYNDDMLYILSESIDTEKKENDNYNKNNEIDRIKVNILNALNETETEDTNNNNKNNNNTITFKEQGIQTNNDEYINESQPSSNKKNDNSQFQPLVIETLPDFRKQQTLNHDNQIVNQVNNNEITNENIQLHKDKIENSVHSACGCDMMSDVLAFVKDQAVLITGLCNPQVVRTAEMMDMRCIVFVRGKNPPPEVVALAKESGIVVLSSNERMYVACGLLYTNGLSGGSVLDE